MAIDQVACINRLIERFAYRTYINILFDVIIISEQQRINYMLLIMINVYQALERTLQTINIHVVSILGHKFLCKIEMVLTFERALHWLQFSFYLSKLCIDCSSVSAWAGSALTAILFLFEQALHWLQFNYNFSKPDLHWVQFCFCLIWRCIECSSITTWVDAALSAVQLLLKQALYWL